MAWDDEKSTGDELTSPEWNDHVEDQKNHSERHEEGGPDALSLAVDQIQNFGSNVLSSIQDNTIAPSDITDLWDGTNVTANVNNESVVTDEANIAHTPQGTRFGDGGVVSGAGLHSSASVLSRQRDTKAVMTITYDDESEYIYDYAFPVHKDEEVPGLFYVVPSRIGTGDTYDWGPADEWDRIREMHETAAEDGGIEIGDHSYDHTSRTDLSYEELIEDYQLSHDEFLKNGIVARHHAYPFGDNDPQSRHVTQSFFSTARNNAGAYNDSDRTIPTLISTRAIDDRPVSDVKSDIDEANAGGKWLDTFMHAVHPDGEVTSGDGTTRTVKTPSELQEIIEYAKSQGVKVVEFDDAVERFVPREYWTTIDHKPTRVTKRSGYVEPGRVDPMYPGPFSHWRAESHTQQATLPFESLDRYNFRDSGTGGNSLGFNGITLSTGSDAGSESLIETSVRLPGGFSEPNALISGKVTGRIHDPEARTILGLGAVYDSGVGDELGRAHVGIMVDDGDVYASTGDGTHHTTLLESNVSFGTNTGAIIEYENQNRARVRLVNLDTTDPSDAILAEGVIEDNFPATLDGTIAGYISNESTAEDYQVVLNFAEVAFAHRSSWSHQQRVGDGLSEEWF